MSSITVFTLPNCVQCTATFRALDKAGLDYHVVDLEQDVAAVDALRSQGYLRAPVVRAGSEMWSGFRPDLIQDLQRRARVA